MKKGFFEFVVAPLGMLLAGAVLSQVMNGQTEISKAALVSVMRTLNDAEYSCRDPNRRFAAREELLAFLQKNGQLSRLPINLENPKPYELAITTSRDGTHYQITLERPSDMHDKSTWCKPAAFTDDRGLIFLGLAIGCEAAPQ